MRGKAKGDEARVTHRSLLGPHPNKEVQRFAPNQAGSTNLLSEIWLPPGAPESTPLYLFLHLCLTYPRSTPPASRLTPLSSLVMHDIIVGDGGK